MSKHFRSLRVKDIIRETTDSVSVVFEVPQDLQEEFSYSAGQYLSLKTQINGEEVRRSYSLSSCPLVDKSWKITSKKVPMGKMSSFLDKELKVGMQMDVMPPDGSFTAENILQPNHFVLFAAGSGITPIISILKSLLVEHSENRVDLYYGNANSNSIIFKEEIQELQQANTDRFNVLHLISREGPFDSFARAGRLDEDTVLELMQDMDEINSKEYFICGPEGMITSCKSALEKLNIASSKIHIEYFASPKTMKEEKVQKVMGGDVYSVKVIIDEVEHQIQLNSDETILEAAQRLGIDPPFSCQSGVCTTCQAKVLSGNVEMENNFGLADEEVEEGFVLTCISKPTSPGVIVSWDEV